MEMIRNIVVLTALSHLFLGLWSIHQKKTKKMQMQKRLKQNVYANVNLMQFDRQSKHNLPNNPVCPPISNEFRNLKCFKGEILNTRLTLIFLVL